MTKITKKIVTWIFGAIAFVAFSFGLVFAMPQVKTAQAADTAVNFNEALLEGDVSAAGVMQIRLNTEGQTWATYHNDKLLSELPGVANYTTINGRSLADIEKSSTSEGQIRLTLQPAGSFSVVRVFIPLDMMTTSEIRSIGVLDGWNLASGETTFTSPTVTYLRSGDTMVKPENYTANTKLTSADITISDAQLVHRVHAGRGADSYMVDIAMGGMSFGEYDTMYGAMQRLVR